MDPNANLKEQLILARRIVANSDDETSYVNSMDAARLAELVIALDEWLRVGGFLPDVWSKGRG